MAAARVGWNDWTMGKCRYCGEPRPEGYTSTCGASACQEAHCNDREIYPALGKPRKPTRRDRLSAEAVKRAQATPSPSPASVSPVVARLTDSAPVAEPVVVAPGPWRIACAVSGGVTGNRRALLKANGAEVCFATEAAAKAEADRLSASANGNPYRTAAFAYWPVLDEDWRG